MAEYAFDWQAGIDELFFDEPPGMSFTASPGRMALIAAAMFVMRGLALLLMILRQYIQLVQWLALISGVIALLPIVGYMFGDPLFPRIGHSSGISAHAALGLLVLSVGILLATADRGFMARLQSKLKIISLTLSLGLLMVSVGAILHKNHQSRQAADQLQQTYQQLNLLNSLQSDLFELKAANYGRNHANAVYPSESPRLLHKFILDKLNQLLLLNPTSMQQLGIYASLLNRLFPSEDETITQETDDLLNNLITILREIEVQDVALLGSKKQAAELKYATLNAVMFFTLALGFGILIFAVNAMRREIGRREKAEQFEKSRSQVLGSYLLIKPAYPRC